MALPKGENPNHPEAGSTTKVEPIKDIKAIRRIKKILADKPRDLCLFTVGVNTAYRANELLSIQVNQVDHLREGDILEIKQSKTKKYRGVVMNKNVIAAIDHWLTVYPGNFDEGYLFSSQRGDKALTVPYVNNLVKAWCQNVGLKGNYGSHSLRKTWGYHQRIQRNAPIPLFVSIKG